MIDRSTLKEERARREAEGLAKAASAPEMASEEWVTFPGPDGPVRVLVLTPKDVASPAAHVFVHGGGWVFGSPLQTVGLARRMAHQARRPVASVAYSLAPEFTFPRPIRDVAAVYDGLAAEGRLGGAIGFSAGAQIVLAAAMMRRDAGAAMPGGIVLFNGGFAMTTDSETHAAHGALPTGLTTAAMRDYIEAYGVAGAADGTYGDLTAARLDGLPPLWFSCGDIDPLLADTLIVFRTALAARNAARLHVIPGLKHGFSNDWHVDPAADDAVGQSVAWLESVTKGA